MRAPVGGPIQMRAWHLRREAIEANADFVARCLKLWDQGCNTKDISLAVFQPEYVVETATRLGRERRRANGGRGYAESAGKKEDDPQWA